MSNGAVVFVIWAVFIGIGAFVMAWIRGELTYRRIRREAFGSLVREGRRRESIGRAVSRPVHGRVSDHVRAGELGGSITWDPPEEGGGR